LFSVEVKKMELNKIGMHVKRNINGSLNKLFGIITKFEKSQAKLHKKAKSTEMTILINKQ